MRLQKSAMPCVAVAGSAKSRALATGSLAALVLAAIGAGGPAYAQAADAAPAAAAAPSSEVVVTGSRITRRDFTSNSPIVTVGAEKFQNTSNVAVDSTLNKLPQFSPAQRAS